MYMPPRKPDDVVRRRTARDRGKKRGEDGRKVGRATPARREDDVRGEAGKEKRGKTPGGQK